MCCSSYLVYYYANIKHRELFIKRKLKFIIFSTNRKFFYAPGNDYLLGLQSTIPGGGLRKWRRVGLEWAVTACDVQTGSWVSFHGLEEGVGCL